MLLSMGFSLGGRAETRNADTLRITRHGDEGCRDAFGDPLGKGDREAVARMISRTGLQPSKNGVRKAPF